MSQVLSNTKNSKGITLVEVAVGVSLLFVVVLMSMTVMSVFLEARKEAQHKTKALYLAEEGHEIIRFIRDNNWDVIGSDLGVDTRYFINASSTFVATTTIPEVIDGVYHREFLLRDVYRNNISDDIVASTSGSSYVDSDSREIVMRVGYPNGTTTLRSLLTNIFDI